MVMAIMRSGHVTMVDYTPASSYAAGDVVVIGNTPFVAHLDNPEYSGGPKRQGALSAFGGVYLMAADGAIAVGAVCYWNATASQVSADPTVGDRFGILIAGPTLLSSDAGPTTAADACLVFHSPTGSATGVGAALIDVSAALTATDATRTVFVATRACKLASVKEVHSVASTSGTLQIEKCTGTTAPGSGTNLLTGTISLAGTANTVLTGTLIATTATLTLAAGDRLSVVIAGTMTNLVGCVVTISLAPE